MKGLPDFPEGDHRPIAVLLLEKESASELGVRCYLKEAPAFRLAGVAPTVARARALCSECRAELVVLDPEIEGMGGIALIHQLARRKRPIPCVAWLRTPRREIIESALRAGARAVALRTEPLEELITAAIHAFVDWGYLSPAASQIADGPCGGVIEPSWRQWQRLPPRLREVFLLLSAGFSVEAIAREAGVASKTVRAHLDRLRTVFGLPTLAALRLAAELISHAGSVT